MSLPQVGGILSSVHVLMHQTATIRMFDRLFFRHRHAQFSVRFSECQSQTRSSPRHPRSHQKRSNLYSSKYGANFSCNLIALLCRLPAQSRPSGRWASLTIPMANWFSCVLLKCSLKSGRERIRECCWMTVRRSISMFLDHDLYNSKTRGGASRVDLVLVCKNQFFDSEIPSCSPIFVVISNSALRLDIPPKTRSTSRVAKSFLCVRLGSAVQFTGCHCAKQHSLTKYRQSSSRPTQDHLLVVNEPAEHSFKNSTNCWTYVFVLANCGFSFHVRLMVS